MFTGIIEETGTVHEIKRGAHSCVLTISGDVIFSDLKIGDSVAVNGVCLTAAHINGKTFSADVMAETMRRSNLGMLIKGSRVNLERAMSAQGRFGGHIVSGHIDGTGILTSARREENAVWLTVTVDEDLMRYIVMKGSVALDGISLTVAKVFKDALCVSVIPHTGAETTLLEKRPGDKINIECDIIGKYVEKLINKSGGITEEFLSTYGF